MMGSEVPEEEECAVEWSGVECSGVECSAVQCSATMGLLDSLPPSI